MLDHPHPLALTDRQMAEVAMAARVLPIDKRDLFLQRFAAHLSLRGGHITDEHVQQAVQQALQGLVHARSVA